MARIGIYPRFTAFDSSGNPVANGTVYTYITGTSTPKNTYSSSASANPSTSFTLDAGGGVNMNSVKVRYFDTDVAYRLVIKDSVGTTLYTIDDYIPISSLTVLDQNLDVNGHSIVSSSNGNIAITPDGTGDLILDGKKWPQTDGTAGQVIKTDGAGQLGWVSIATDLLNDTTPQLGATLDANSYNIEFDSTTGIKDDAHNEQLLFTKVASAVNYVNITNSATGNPVIIEAKGDDTNIGFNAVTKGSGVFKINGITYPAADGTANQMMRTDGAGTISFGAPLVAAQSDMETATSTTTYVTPGRLQYHPGVCKGWIMGTPAAANSASLNVTSITDNGSGDWTVNWTTAFSSANYAVATSAAATNNGYSINIKTLAAGSVRVEARKDDGTLSETNLNNWFIAAYGDQ